MIHTIETSFPADPTSPRAPAERVPARFFRKRFDLDWTAPKSVGLGATVPAYVNDSRWVARCYTFPVCLGAELVSRDDPRLFCCSCLNAAVGGQWVQVVFPDDADEIETVLSARPVPPHRHWVPGESVADLKDENAERGVA